MAINYSLPRIFVMALAGMALATAAGAQTTSTLTLIVSDANNGAAPGRDTLYWGFDPAATNGKDAALGEEEQPPAPPEGVFDVRWVNVGTSADFGQGVKKNFHPGGAGMRDTFRVKVQPAFKPGSSGYPVVMAWPDLKSYFESASLRFVDGDGEAQTMDMLSGTSFTFTNAASVTSTVTIITSGAKDPSSGIEIPTGTRGFAAAIVPNPVRRAVGGTISYTIPVEASVTVKLYDAAGTLVRSIDAGRRSAATHTMRFDLGGLPLGGYYAVITAGTLTATRSFVLID